MKLPYLYAGRRAAVRTEHLGGLCLTGEWRNGELDGGDRLSTDGSPGLCPRVPPLTEGQYDAPQALWAGSGLVVAAGGQLFYNGAPVGTVSAGPKQMAAVGTCVVIFPDKKYIDTVTGQMGDMEAAITLSGAVFESGGIARAGVDWPFAVGDGVTITGCSEYEQNNQTLIIRNVDENGLWFDDGVFDAGTEPGPVTLQRRVPDLEVVCESGNRLWGCAGNTIYGSRLGDPLNFFVYDGLSTDSYALETAGGGAFTGCAPYSSHIVFFKENMACKLYGTRPANYQLMTVHIPGVRRGCAGTLWNDSEDLYYLGAMGLYAYAGGVPELLSDRLGPIEGSAACGCVWMGRYYLSAVVGGRPGICTYDIRRRVWLPWENDTQAVGFGETGGQMRLLTRDGRLLLLDAGSGGEEWSAELRPFRDGTGRSSRCTSVVIDAQASPGAWFALDWAAGEGAWQQAALFDGRRQGLRTVRLPPNRGSGLRLRLRGCGDCRIRAVERRLSVGGAEE